MKILFQEPIIDTGLLNFMELHASCKTRAEIAKKQMNATAVQCCFQCYLSISKVPHTKVSEILNVKTATEPNGLVLGQLRMTVDYLQSHVHI